MNEQLKYNYVIFFIEEYYRVMFGDVKLNKQAFYVDLRELSKTLKKFAFNSKLPLFIRCIFFRLLLINLFRYIKNTTDKTILGLIRNSSKSVVIEEGSNKNEMIAATQRDLIAGEVSTDLSKRVLLPEKIKNAWEEGILYFHDSDYFIQPIFNCCLINIEDMLDNGTVINGNMIETPKSFQVACIVTSQIIATVASNQYGEQSIDTKCLGKYLRKSKDKFKEEILEEFGKDYNKETVDRIVERKVRDELKAGVQTIQYQINTVMTTNGQAPFLTLFLHLDLNDEYIEENSMIIEEIIRQRQQGIKNSDGEFITPDYPKLIYVLDECNNLTGGKYDYLTKLAIECSKKRKYPAYISAKKMRENFEGNVFSPMGYSNFLIPWKDDNGNYKFEGRFNQGIVSINLPQVAIVAEGDEKRFWELLDERLELCKEALTCRHYALVGTLSDISPIHWKYGAIARLEKGEKIDKLLYGGYSTISLGYVGITEAARLMKGESLTAKEKYEFCINVIQYIKNKVLKWRKELNIGFSLLAITDKDLCYNFAKIDRERFGTIEGITDKEYYSNSYNIDNKDGLEMNEKLKLEAEFQKI